MLAGCVFFGRLLFECSWDCGVRHHHHHRYGVGLFFRLSRFLFFLNHLPRQKTTTTTPTQTDKKLPTYLLKLYQRKIACFFDLDMFFWGEGAFEHCLFVPFRKKGFCIKALFGMMDEFDLIIS